MGTEDRTREVNYHFNDLRDKILPIMQKILIEYIDSCPCQIEAERVHAVFVLIETAVVGLGEKIGYDITAKMLEALAKDLRIHGNKTDRP